MKRTSTAVVLAAFLYAAWPSAASANPPKQCGPFCLLHFQKLHQHGPLFNYGPYYGYPPFEPYGPWNSYLQYNPWYYGDPYAGGGHGLFGGHGHGLGLGNKCHGCGHGFHSCWAGGGWFRGNGCLTCGHHAKGGGFGCLGCGRDRGCQDCGHGGHGLFHHKEKGGCSTCAAGIDPATTDAVTRYAGVGTPVMSAAYYTGLPTLDPTFAK